VTPPPPISRKPPTRGRLKQPPLPTFSESELQRAIIDALNVAPDLRAWRQQSGRLKVRGGFMCLAPNGAGDIVGTAAPDGLHFEVEVKGPKTEVQADQDPWGEATAAAGAVYVRARPLRGETLPVSVARCVAELRAAIEEVRANRAAMAAEKVAS
jgi:hypothetical protein